MRISIDERLVQWSNDSSNVFDVLPLINQYNSLAKLRTHYIDILYVHWWDWNTSMEEVMDGLHNLVVAGKVLYLVCAVTFQTDVGTSSK